MSGPASLPREAAAMPGPEGARAFYPTPAQVDAWAEETMKSVEEVAVRGEYLEGNNITTSFGNGPNTLINRYVRFTCSDGRREFYGYWQPAISQPAPLLINLPGYGGCISAHPQLCDMGFHVLHISPQGYVTPRGENAALQRDGYWPVLYNTAAGLPGGYRDWLGDCLLAIRWAQALPGVLPGRLSLFGTSQGGGGSLLLASLLQEKVRCVCADLPFLTNFPLSRLEGPAYSLLRPALAEVGPQEFWRNLGYVDTLSHAHRIRVPAMLSAGGQDDTCPPATVKSLFEALGCSKQYTELGHVPHTHSRESMVLFGAWLRLFA